MAEENPVIAEPLLQEAIPRRPAGAKVLGLAALLVGFALGAGWAQLSHNGPVAMFASAIKASPAIPRMPLAARVPFTPIGAINAAQREVYDPAKEMWMPDASSMQAAAYDPELDSPSVPWQEGAALAPNGCGFCFG